jgi:MFS family permease
LTVYNYRIPLDDSYIANYTYILRNFNITIFKLIIFFSVFAFGENYWVLFIARAVQGIGSSCSSVAGKHGSSEVNKIPSTTVYIHFYRYTYKSWPEVVRY